MKRIGEILAKRNSKTYIEYLKKCGCKIGEYTHLHDPKTFYIDKSRLKYIEIGKYVQITRNVTILAHDFSYSVLMKTHKSLPQKLGTTIIGNNVFIGMNSIILMGSKIGNNVVIGAGSVVSGIIPNNCVVAGNPARVICSIEEYYNKCIEKYEKKLYELCKYHKEKYNSFPNNNEITYCNLEYMDSDEKEKYLENFLYPAIEKEEIENYVKNHKRKYISLEAFYQDYEKRFNNEKK